MGSQEEVSTYIVMDDLHISHTNILAPYSNSVMRFRHSSYYLGQYIASQGKTLQEKYLVSENDYVVHGGAFPLIIKGVGAIGTVTVSGLAQQVGSFPYYSASSSCQLSAES